MPYEPRMSYLPLTEETFSRPEYKSIPSAITVRDLLERTELGEREYYLYEGVIPSALLGEASTGLLFEGLPNEDTLPLLACRGAQAKAIFENLEDELKAPKVCELIKEQFPRLAYFDVTFLIAPSVLDNSYSAEERKEYFNEYLPERSLSCRKENVSYYSSHYYPPDSLSPFLDLEPDTDWPLSDDMDYGETIEAAINCLQTELHEAFLTETPYTFSTIPLECLMRELRLDCDYMELLREKHLLKPGPVLRPTAFGRQCGLVVRLKLSNDKKLVDRELRVVPCAAGAFKQAVAFKKSMKEEQGQALADRLQSMDKWLPTSTAQPIIPGLLKLLRESMRVPVETLERSMEKTRSHQLMELLLHNLQPGLMADFRRLLDLTAAKLRKKNVQDDYTSLEGGPENDLWHMLQLFTFFMFAEGRAKRAKGAESPGTLSERLDSLGHGSIPIKNMELRHYFLAIACACDSTYPLWICQELGIMDILETLDIGPCDTVEKAARAADSKLTTFWIRRFSYITFVRPMLELPYKF